VVAAIVSRFCLVVSLASIGIMQPWRSLVSYGWQPLALLALLSALLLALMTSFVIVMPFA